MLRVPLNKAYIKRTIRPLYGWTQATPQSNFLDPAWNNAVDIFPGMCMMRKGGDLVTLVDGTGFPYGLSALYVAPSYGVDEVTDVGVNVFSTWVLGPDAQFEILAPAFDDSVTWTDPTDGTTVLVHAWATGTGRGKLVPAGATKASHTLTTKPVARLAKVASASKIVVAGLVGTGA